MGSKKAKSARTTDTADTAAAGLDLGADAVTTALRLEPGASVDLTERDPRGRPVGPRDKEAAAADLAAVGERLDALQEALYAEKRHAVLLVLQGMDTSGKGGVISHVAGLVNPQGLHIATFGRPTEEDLAHDFLWRVRRQAPAPGRIGVFDRSHYEDVLVVRVDGLVPESEWRPRYDVINDFEAELAANGVTIVKCFLHISPDEQRERLLARLDDPQKRWKYNPRDVDVRLKWPAYAEAYTEALTRCGTDAAPWHVVPSDRKWYRNWAIARLLLEALERVDPRFPEPAFDVEAERRRVEESDPFA